MSEVFVGEIPPAPPPLPSARWKWMRRLVAILVLMVVSSVGFYYYNQYRQEQEYQEAIAEVDRLDPGWQWEELNARRAAIPDERNSALTVMAIRQLLPSSWPPVPVPYIPNAKHLIQRINEIEPPVVLSTALRMELVEELENVESVLVEARRLIGMETGRYPLVYAPDGVSTMMVAPQESRKIAWLLCWDAVLLADENQPDPALDCARGVLNVGRANGDEPFLIAQLIRMVEVTQAWRSMERTLAQGQPTEKALKAAQQALEQEEQALPALLLAATRGERATAHQAMLALKRGDMPLSLLAGISGGGVTGFDNEIMDRLGSGIARRGHGRLLQLTTQLVEIAKLPLPEQVPRFQQWKKESLALRAQAGPSNPGLVVTAFVAPGLETSFAAFHRNHAQLRCAFAALAAERFRRQHGRWPTSLGELCPAYLKEVPTDPFDNQPLRFRRLADGVVIYSIGADGKDDGGKLARNSPLMPGTDVGFQLWDVEQRRQAAKKE